MSAIHIHNWATKPPIPTLPTTTSTSTSTSTSPSPKPPYLNPPTLSQASLVLPPAALAHTATSSKTTSNTATPTITHQGPDTVDIPPTPNNPNPRTKSLLKNGYVPKGYALNADGTCSNTDKNATGTRYHTTETSMSATSEALEGGGQRRVWVRTERHITVLIQGVKADDEE